MAAPQQKFEAGLSKVRGLRAAAAATTDLVNEAWSALRTGVIVARRLPEVLDSCPKEERPHVLRFILERAAQKKAARAQAEECLRILLARPPWLATARAEEGLRSGVREALDGERDAELLGHLAAEEAAEEPAEGAAEEEAEVSWLEESGAPEAAAPASEEPASAPPQPPPAISECLARALPWQSAAAPASEQPGAAPPRPPRIRERLARGAAVLERFRWEFPRDPIGTRGDEATAGFQAIFDAVTALTIPSGRASVGDDPSAALVDLERHWADLLRFLVSMYNSGVKRTYSSRIRFVALHLRELSPAFRDLAPWASLPWGRSPAPRREAEAAAGARQDEVEARASARKEPSTRRAEDAKKLRPAHKTQRKREEQAAKEAALEEVRRRSVREARRRSVQGDLTLACKLQEEEKERPGEATSWLSRIWLLNIGGA